MATIEVRISRDGITVTEDGSMKMYFKFRTSDTISVSSATEFLKDKTVTFAAAGSDINRIKSHGNWIGAVHTMGNSPDFHTAYEQAVADNLSMTELMERLGVRKNKLYAAIKSYRNLCKSQGKEWKRLRYEHRESR